MTDEAVRRSTNAPRPPLYNTTWTLVTLYTDIYLGSVTYPALGQCLVTGWLCVVLVACWMTTSDDKVQAQLQSGDRCGYKKIKGTMITISLLLLYAYTARQRRTAVTVYLKSKQLLLFAFVRQRTYAEWLTGMSVSSQPNRHENRHDQINTSYIQIFYQEFLSIKDLQLN